MGNLAVIFNAPKETGKDHAVEYIANRMDKELPRLGDPIGIPMMFKEPLYLITSSIYGVPYQELVEDATDRIKKETPMEKYGGLSPRQTIIDVSENLIKPYYGKSFFGKAAVVTMGRIDENMGETPVIFLFSDSGFSEEAQPVIDKVGSENTIIVRIHRDGYGYDGDSRRYLTEDDFEENIRFIDVFNNGSLEDFEKSVYDIVADFIKTRRRDNGLSQN